MKVAIALGMDFCILPSHRPTAVGDVEAENVKSRTAGSRERRKE